MSNISKLKIFLDNVLPTLAGKAKGPNKTESATFTIERAEDEDDEEKDDGQRRGWADLDEEEKLERKDPPAPPPSGKSKDVILGLQKALKKVGYDPGPIDGIMGKKTSEALKQFQRDNGLAADGVAGSATQAAMAKALRVANG